MQRGAVSNGHPNLPLNYKKTAKPEAMKRLYIGPAGLANPGLLFCGQIFYLYTFDNTT